MSRRLRNSMDEAKAEAKRAKARARRARRKAAAAAKNNGESQHKLKPRWKKGVSANPSGRPKGIPNKTTRESKEFVVMIIQKNEAKVQGWIERTARKNPAKAVELILRFLEFVKPKLTRTELRLPPEMQMNGPIATDEEASRTYLALMQGTEIDLSAITYDQPPVAVQPARADSNVVDIKTREKSQ